MNESSWMPDRPWTDRRLPEETDRAPLPARRNDDLSVDRRGFLQLLGAGGAAASLAACERVPVHHALPFAIGPEEVRAGVPVQYASSCSACPASCGLVATVRDGRPIKLDGHPGDSRTQGGLCAIGQADLRALYDPGRLRGPTRDREATTWKELDETVRRRLDEIQAAGRSIVVVSGTETSPTGRRLIEEFVAGRGSWIELDLDPRSPTQLAEAYRLLTGEALVPSTDLRAADVVVSISSDFLGTGPDPVTDTRAYADRRRQAEERGALSHLQIEGSLSLTGAAADRRRAASSSERRLLTFELLREVARNSGGTESPAVLTALSAWPADSPLTGEAREIAASLVSAAPRALVLCGDDDLGQQLAVALINRLLDTAGHTLHLDRPSLIRRERPGAVAELMRVLRDDRTGALVAIDVDPVRQLPNADELAARIAALPLAVAIASRPTATSRACGIVAAAHHGLECWGDRQPEAGRWQLQQPMVQPLFDTRSPLENLLHWMGAAETDYLTHLKEGWAKHVPRPAEVAFDRFWHDCVSAGGAPGGEPPTAETPSHFELDGALEILGRAGAEAPSASPELELELLTEVALRDGRRAHVPWLRELPDPLTRVSWVPALRIAPNLADRLQVEDGDVLEVRAGEQSLRLPARIVPGQHPQVVGVPVGYGVESEEAHWNAYRLAAFDGQRLGWTAPIERLQKTGVHEKLPLMQVWSSTEGRPIVHQVSSPEEAVPAAHHGASNSLWPEREKPSPQWHMSVDLDACTGCGACVVACQVENNIPVVGAQGMREHRDMHWLRVDRYYLGEEEDPDVLFQPMLCAHCDHAPCETVCPVVATAHSHDGLNQQAYNRCVGTRYCANNCPYKVRRFNWFDYRPTDAIERLVLNPDVVVRSRGVMEKCTFCVQRIQSARLAARKEGRGGVPEVQTACQQSCPAAAIRFGDATDPDGEIEADRHEPRAFQALAELGIEPSITYLARVRNRSTSGAETGPESNRHGD